MKALVAATIVATAGSIAAWATAIPASTPTSSRGAVGTAAPETPAPDTMALAASAARLRLHDPFRLERKPADVRYDPWQPVTTPAIAAAPVRPTLSLAGLVGGPPWNALVEGIPGRESGALLLLGDSAGGLRFVALRGDTVVLAGFDTTWSLTARRAWH